MKHKAFTNRGTLLIGT